MFDSTIKQNPTIRLGKRVHYPYPEASKIDPNTLVCQCLNHLSTLRRNSTVTIAGEHRKTGQQFVESVLGLSHKLLQLGLSSGHVVAICAYNRFVIKGLG